MAVFLVDGGPQMTKPLFNSENFLEQFCEDLASAGKSAFISASHLSRTQVRKVLAALSGAIEQGVKCTVNVHVANDLAGEKKTAVEMSLNMLRETGCFIVKSAAFLSDFAVIDSTVWYGSIPLLGKPNEEACSLRIIDADVAHELVNEQALAMQ